METEEVIKLVDNIYKNILDKFNPGARQLISAGKVYLKALHGTAAASQVFNDALAKIAVNAQQGGTNDIGSALINIVDVYKDIHDQHMNILKAFYVDLLVPLETNLEKDTKVVQFEQKKFLQQHKIRADSYSKATATMKKQRKKKGNAQNTEKEIKSIQAVDEEKNKLEAFCEQSLKNAMTQERRRYGFVLERQCSLAKHWIAYHSAGKNFILNNLDNWEEVSASREFLPSNMENVFARQMIMDMNNDSNNADMDNDSDRSSVISAMRKTRSIDASCLEMRSIGDVVNSATTHMPRAKSEFNLTSAASAAIEAPKWDQRTVSRGLYAYLSSGENQLSFLEGDRIALVGDRAKGWQFGENLRTHTFGWFPVAYTELEHEKNLINWGSSRNGYESQSQQQHPMKTQQQAHPQYQQTRSHSTDHHHQHHQNENDNNDGQQPQHHQHQQQQKNHTPDSSIESNAIDELALPQQVQQAYHDDASPARMFGDTIMYRQSKQFRRVSGGIAVHATSGPKPGPPPALPAPVPQPIVPILGPSLSSGVNKSHHNHGQTFVPRGNANADGTSSQPLSNAELRKPMTTGANGGKQGNVGEHPKARNGVVATNNVSLHSSNDSGFANELAPPQPEVDYSDDETVTRVPIRQSRQVIQRSTSNANVAIAIASKKSSRIPTRRVHDGNDTSNEATLTKQKSTVATSSPLQSKSSSTLTRPTKSNGNKANSTTIRSSTSYGNLTLANEQQQQQQQNNEFLYRTLDRKSARSSSNGNIIKRTKSFWKFGKDDDILEGMAMWRHRDLVPTTLSFNSEQDDETIGEINGTEPIRSNDDVVVATLGRRMKQRQSEPPVQQTIVSAQQQHEFNGMVATVGGRVIEETQNNNSNKNHGDMTESMDNYLGQDNIIMNESSVAGGNKYHFTKSDIDNRISAMKQQTTQQPQLTQQQHQLQLQQQQQQQHHHRSSIAYETPPEEDEEEDESIYDVQPKTRQIAVMSRDKVIRQARHESELEMQEQRHADKFRNSPQHRTIAHNSAGQTMTSAQQNTAQKSNNNVPLVQASSKKKKKTTNASSKSTHQKHHQQQPVLTENYVRTETPDTIHHEDNHNAIINDNAVRMRDTDFYDDESVDDVAIMMKTVKRQDILKQYYNSSDGGTDDTEQNSTSSDAYDCIVVEDHQVARRGQRHQKHNGFADNADTVAMPNNDVHALSGQQPMSAKMDFKTFRGGSDDKDSGMESSRPGTLLPRTKLSKGTSGNVAAVLNSQQSAAGAGSSVPNGAGKRSRTDRAAPTTERNDDRSERRDRNKTEPIEKSHDRTTVNRSVEYRPHHDVTGDNFYRSSDVESAKSYGPWYDLWGQDMTMHK